MYENAFFMTKETLCDSAFFANLVFFNDVFKVS